MLFKMLINGHYIKTENGIESFESPSDHELMYHIMLEVASAIAAQAAIIEFHPSSFLHQ